MRAARSGPDRRVLPQRVNTAQPRLRHARCLQALAHLLDPTRPRLARRRSPRGRQARYLRGELQDLVSLVRSGEVED